MLTSNTWPGTIPAHVPPLAPRAGLGSSWAFKCDGELAVVHDAWQIRILQIVSICSQQEFAPVSSEHTLHLESNFNCRMGLSYPSPLQLLYPSQLQ
jgi:hypothetical protein